MKHDVASSKVFATSCGSTSPLLEVARGLMLDPSAGGDVVTVPTSGTRGGLSQLPIWTDAGEGARGP